MKNDDVIYEPKGVQFIDIYITLHYIILYITLGPPQLCVCMVVFLMKNDEVIY